jgi:dTMP kinase
VVAKLARSPFIVFEGLDGSGKSTQVRLLGERLRSLGLKVYETAEPTNSPIGSLIRNIMTGRIVSDHATIAALFVADRLDHLQNNVNGICLKLATGHTVLADRYYFSSYAYHSVHVPMDWVMAANSLCANILRPDLSIFLDVDPNECFRRLNNQNRHLELYESVDALERVRANYLESFERLGDFEIVEIVDGNEGVIDISKRIWELLVERSMIGVGRECDTLHVSI